ncbi:hypothetical protein OKW45_005776 [Paraburkholderia sp. WSM4175]|uniref:hypothetical protein n=1 Tax=Paraburkholderia sp. WSM4175 TaxID=2991072 RepID=UPI003D1F8F2F
MTSYQNRRTASVAVKWVTKNIAVKPGQNFNDRRGLLPTAAIQAKALDGPEYTTPEKR